MANIRVELDARQLQAIRDMIGAKMNEPLERELLGLLRDVQDLLGLKAGGDALTEAKSARTAIRLLAVLVLYEGKMNTERLLSELVKGQ